VSSEKPGAQRLLAAGILTALIDGIFSSVLVTMFYGSTFARLWKGVASVPLGASALEGGTESIAIGLGLHVCVAFFWSAVFFLAARQLEWLRRVIATPQGMLATAAVYGPMIWLVMSLVVIQAFTHKPPNINYRWYVQLIGHIFAVALPIVAMMRKK